MSGFAITFHTCQSCVDNDKTEDTTYHQFWTRMKELLELHHFTQSGNRSVYTSTDKNDDPPNNAKQFMAQLQSEYPNVCNYLNHMFLVNLDDDYNLLREPCGCDSDQ